MSLLIDVWDAAFLGDLSKVPDSVVAIGAYVGGPGAYHVWPKSDVQKVLDSGREVWPIWVPPQGRALTAQDGIDAAAGMALAIPQFGLTDKRRPCFMDIEYGQWDENRTGAGLAASTFQAHMRIAAYTQPYPYCPYGMGRGWVSEYVYSRPQALPAGVIGWQYENDKYRHPGWDASVFDISVYRKTTWELDMDAAVIIRRLDNGKFYRMNVLDGTCNHLVNSDAVGQCKRDLTAAGVPFLTDSTNSIAGYVEVPAS